MTYMVLSGLRWLPLARTSQEPFNEEFQSNHNTVIMTDSHISLQQCFSIVSAILDGYDQWLLKSISSMGDN